MEIPGRQGSYGKSLIRRDHRDFRGVDFSSPPHEVSPERSPDAVNCHVDRAGRLAKRPGYRTVGSYGKRINGIHRFEYGGMARLIVHAGSSLWLHGPEPKLLASDVGSGPSSSAVCRDRLWILTGNKYLMFDGKAVRPVSDIAYVPTVKLACDPKSGAGTLFEAVNLLSDKRRILYAGDGVTKTYTVDTEGFDGIEWALVNGRPVAFCEDMGKRTVTFQRAPAKPEVPGQDNVEIVYRRHIPGNRESIENCRVLGVYGIGGADSDRLFFTGNPRLKNTDWHCGISAPEYNVDPTYIPDDSFARIGSDSCAVVGYRRLGSYQVIVKEQNDQDASLFLRSGGLDGNGCAVFALTQGASGIGGISDKTMANLGDEPLFLSRHNGICGIAVSQVTQHAAVQNRSWFVDGRLREEADLSSAVAAEWCGRYVLCVNGRAYILDSRQSKTYREHSGSSYVYECFFWDGIPACCLCESAGELYFGTAHGELCKFSTDLGDDRGMFCDYPGNRPVSPVKAYWTTPVSDDGLMNRWKKTVSRQCALLTRYDGASGRLKLEFSFDSAPWETAADFTPSGGFSFNNADFSAWSFVTPKMPVMIGVGKKPGRYRTVAMRISNAALGQDLLCQGISRSYYTDKKLKG